MADDRPPAPLRDVAATAFEYAGQELFVLSWEPATVSTLLGLTPAEKAVVTLMLEGTGNTEIARARGTSGRTVANQIASVFRKLGVGSRAELAAMLARGIPSRIPRL
jgi:DNA-binding CsgD family transcriptional regulator